MLMFQGIHSKSTSKSYHVSHLETKGQRNWVKYECVYR